MPDDAATMSNGDVLERRKVEFEYIQSEDHRTYVTNRIWGGTIAGGLFEMNLMLERKPLPERVSVAIEDDRMTGEISRRQADHLFRENLATVYMSIETMLSLHGWLGGKVQQLQEAGVLMPGEPDDQ